MTRPHVRDPEADRLPGSRGERALQQRYGTVERAGSFYARQVLDRLNDRMREFVARQELWGQPFGGPGVDRDRLGRAR